MTKITLCLKVAIIGVAIVTTTLAIHGSDRELSDRQKRVHSVLELEKGVQDGPPIASVSVNLTTPINVVDERFISIGATLNSVIHLFWRRYFNSTRFRTVTRGLSPALYRLGGAESDFTIFKDNHDDQQDGRLGKFFFHNITMTAHVWDDIHEFTRDVGWDVFFSLNALLRNGTKWDPTNAIQLIDYTVKRGYKTTWSLGNEPNGFVRKANISVTPEQLADSFQMLRNLMSSRPSLRSAVLVGPDVSAPKKAKSSTLTSTSTYLDEFLRYAGNSTNATTFHFYFLGGRSVSIQNLTSPAIADLVEANIKIVRDIINKYRLQQTRIWITESGLTFGGATEGLSSSFLAGMLILDKFGSAARAGAEVVVQQILVGRSSGLLDKKFNPRLNYWLLLYHKRLMGTRVLNATKFVTSSRKTTTGAGNNFDFSNYIRIYAHCTKVGTKYGPGAVTLMIINMVPIEDIHVNLEGELQESHIHEYFFQPTGPEGILSPYATLNGERLMMSDELTLPYHSPVVMAPRSTIKMPPQTYGFYVLSEANASVCLP